MDEIEDMFDKLKKAINEAIKDKEKQIVTEKTKDGVIQEAVLLCHPTVANAIKNALLPFNINIDIIVSSSIKDDCVYTIVDKDIIDNYRKMIGGKYGK